LTPASSGTKYASTIQKTPFFRTKLNIFSDTESCSKINFDQAGRQTARCKISNGSGSSVATIERPGKPPVQPTFIPLADDKRRTTRHDNSSPVSTTRALSPLPHPNPPPPPPEPQPASPAAIPLRGRGLPSHPSSLRYLPTLPPFVCPRRDLEPGDPCGRD
jgi:hypothetical protein